MCGSAALVRGGLLPGLETKSKVSFFPEYTPGDRPMPTFCALNEIFLFIFCIFSPKRPGLLLY
jgi:hypothetical protein